MASDINRLRSFYDEFEAKSAKTQTNMKKKWLMYPIDVEDLHHFPRAHDHILAKHKQWRFVQTLETTLASMSDVNTKAINQSIFWKQKVFGLKGKSLYLLRPLSIQNPRCKFLLKP